ncbi:MAG: threonine/serine dehydratase [Proteobacteria bacterium]|nr:threonine/serine dehydratase [Pseudomonadota bacterium]
MSSQLPQFEDVAAAAARLKGQSQTTPLLIAPLLDEIAGARVLIKAETLQIAGAFKFRGAYNRLVQLDAAERRNGVVAWSSGNHAQGVAAAGRRLGIRSTIVMPSDAPAIKVENTRRLGADIVFYNRHTENREEIGRRLTEERGATLVPSYDDPHIIAGQGTVALEMAAQAYEQHGVRLDDLLVPCGGGGLVAGCALALTGASPGTRVYCVEPADYDDTARSLASGQREVVRAGAMSLCDALLAPTPGKLTFEINRALLSGGRAVTDAQVMEAMAFAWRELKLVVEPGGAVALAAVLSGAFRCEGRTVGVVLSGGNVDSEVYLRAMR